MCSTTKQGHDPVRRCLRAWLVLLPALLGASPLTAQELPASPSASPPRLVAVPQSVAYEGIQVSARSSDNRFIVTSSGWRLQVWSPADGALLRELRLPTLPGLRPVDWVDWMAVAPDNRHVLARASAVIVGASDGVEQDERKVCFDVDTMTGLVTGQIMATSPRPGRPAGRTADRRTADRPSPPCPPGAEPDDGPDVRPALGPAIGRTRFMIEHAALSPDGSQLAILSNGYYRGGTFVAGDDTTVSLDVVSLIDGRYAPPIVITDPHAGAYNRVTWVDEGHVALSNENAPIDTYDDMYVDPDDQTAMMKPVVFAAATGQPEPAPIAYHCFIRTLGQGRLIGAAPRNCQYTKDAQGIAVFAPGSGWRTLPIAGLARQTVVGLEVAPDGSRVALTLHTPAGQWSVRVADTQTGATIAATPLPPAKVSAAAVFAGDAQHLIVAADDRRYAWTTGPSAPRLIVPAGRLPLSNPPHSILSDGQIVYEYGVVPLIHRYNAETGAALPPIEAGETTALGLAPDRPLLWVASPTDGVSFYDRRTGRLLLTSLPFEDRGFLAITPQGQYDTNLPPDTDRFRWVVSDEPFRALSPQTFMREYYEPGLMARLFHCTFAFDDAARDGCQGQFAEVSSIDTVNRVLPNPPQLTVSPGPQPGTARVTVRVAPASRGGTPSGLFDLRLLLDGRVVATAPAEPAKGPWRKVSALPLGPDGAFQGSFDIALPGPAGMAHQISAYAFNASQVKSDDGTAVYTLAAMPPRKPRAFVLAIGVDHYAETRFRLTYAGEDARLMAKTLSALPGYETHTLALVGDATRPLPRAAVEAALGLLAGKDEAAARAVLAAHGFDAGGLAAAGPDDLVFLTWAGHGIFLRGQFYLAPSDMVWPGQPEGSLPLTSTMISSDDLSRWLAPLRAREITLVIDACNSAYGVKPGFKPAPMGDRGLGQLAFDKGVRILAATQGDSVARESPQLGHGLLSYVLAQGLAGPADRNGDGQVTLEEWLDYPLRTLPGLSNLGLSNLGLSNMAGASRALQELARASGANNPGHAALQIPAAYDFNRTESKLVIAVPGR